MLDTIRSPLQSPFLDRLVAWKGWYQHNYCRILVENVEWLRGKGISSSTLYAEIVSHDVRWSEEDVSKIKRDFQRTALRILKKKVAPNAIERIRWKVERWRGLPFGLYGLPGHYSPRIFRRLADLAALVAPRVHAAVFTTMWNGWCTHRRFQQRRKASNACLFLCGGGAEDAVEHYCRCPVVKRVAAHTLRFSYQDEGALTLWLLNSG